MNCEVTLVGDRYVTVTTSFMLLLSNNMTLLVPNYGVIVTSYARLGGGGRVDLTNDMLQAK